MAKKYIDADRLKELLDAKYKEFTEKAKKDCPLQYQYMADGLDIAEQFIDSLQQEQPAETDEVKWHNDEDYDETDKGRFVLGSVGIGYNGYYIPYSDLLKLPKEGSK